LHQALDDRVLDAVEHVTELADDVFGPTHPDPRARAVPGRIRARAGHEDVEISDRVRHGPTFSCCAEGGLRNFGTNTDRRRSVRWSARARKARAPSRVQVRARGVCIAIG